MIYCGFDIVLKKIKSKHLNELFDIMDDILQIMYFITLIEQSSRGNDIFIPIGVFDSIQKLVEFIEGKYTNESINEIMELQTSKYICMEIELNEPFDPDESQFWYDNIEGNELISFIKEKLGG